MDLNLSITNGIVSSKIYDKWDDFDFEIVNFPFLNGVVPMVYIFLSLFVLQQCVLMLMTSTTETCALCLSVAGPPWLNLRFSLALTICES